MEVPVTVREKTSAGAATRKPRISLTAQDHERLSILARSAINSMPDEAEVLLAELDRAAVLTAGRPKQTVCMGSEVEFRDDTTGKTQTVTLVYPGEADISQGRISILAPIGIALIGLRVGASITWETRGGDRRQLTVLQVQDAAPEE
jgi:regulator of nucleoside diphosphate kinase